MGRWRLNHDWKSTTKSGSEHSCEQNFPCFVAGTLILTARGLQPVERLKIGDRIQTMDNGFQELRWIGKRRISGSGRMAPIRIPAGALHNDTELRVSPQHRMLVTGASVSLLYGEPQAFVPAKSLVGIDGIRRAPTRQVTYVHFMFDNHEVVFANGAPTESLLAGAETASALPAASIREIEELFPELEKKAPLPARLCVRSSMAVGLL